MGQWTFLVWALGLATGIGLSVTFHPGITLLLLMGTAVVAMIFYARRNHASKETTASLFFLFFTVMGILRTYLPDMDLLPEGVRNTLADWSQGATRRLTALSLPSDTTSLLKAMLLGRREGMSLELRELYSQAGASHILALSGLHLGVLFGAFNAVLFHTVSRAAIRWTVGMVSIIIMWAYVFLTGASPSLVRSAVMTTLVVLSFIRQSGFSSWHTLGVAGFVILLVTPSALWSIGFQLSFAGVAGIFLFFRPLCRLMNPRRRIIYPLWQAFCVSFSAQLAVSPLIAYYFHTFSLSAFVLSPAYVLLATLILYTGMMALLGSTWMAALVSPAVGFLADLQHGLMRMATAFG